MESIFDMSLEMESITEYYNYVIYDCMDPRVKGWFLMDSPLPYLTVLVTYLLFVKRVGPWWMKGRRPYNLEKIMLIHNIVQITINVHFVFVALKYIWIPRHYSLACQMPIKGPNPIEDIIVSKFWLFMISRMLDLLDTVFMVLKKNKHQVSFLHLYHHVLVATGCWICVKYMPGGHVAGFGTINAFVHAIMYFYYLLTAIDNSYKKSIWWKRHITELQLAQFIILLFQQLYSLFSPSCEFPKFLLVLFLSQAILMIYLFGDFYNKAYIKQKKDHKKA